MEWIIFPLLMISFWVFFGAFLLNSEEDKKKHESLPSGCKVVFWILFIIGFFVAVYSVVSAFHYQ